MQAKGTFEVKVTPAEGTPLETEAGIRRYTIDKTWSGDLTGTSKGAMLAGMTESTGAMAYVAIEKIEANIAGKSGNFHFSHNGTMKRGDASSSVLKVIVLPDSGTDELAGISGTLTIDIDAKGGHSYVFNYQLP